MSTPSYPKALLQAVRAIAHQGTRPDGRPYRRIDRAAALAVSRSTGASAETVEAAAVASGIVPERYSRNREALSMADQQLLLAATVVVVGLGGLGGTVAEILARAGVGRLILVDGDVFEESNLNRQLNSTVDTIGAGKAAAAAARIAAVNPSTRTVVHPVFLTAENAAARIENADVAADCLDSLTARFNLARAAAARGIPMVTAAVAGTTGQLGVIAPEGPGLAAIYGAPDDAPDKGVEATTGNLPHTVWAVAALEAGEVVNTLLGRSALTGRLLVMDLEDAVFEVVDLSD